MVVLLFAPQDGARWLRPAVQNLDVSFMQMQYCDLFSGIGGISLALSGLVKTVLYCEQDKYCQEILIARQVDGSIDKAPIHNNIQTLHFGEGFQPEMIGGGFPCQDISLAGVQLGMEGTRSSLFFEMMRLVDENPCIRYVFLENVPNIVKCGMQEVVDELTKRGFNFNWMMKSANSMGAPHVRNRWFLLAFKCPATNKIAAPDAAWDWSKEIAPRVTFKPSTTIEDPSYDTNWIQRCQALGNSVVPCVVRSAFIDLWNEMTMTDNLYECLGNYVTDATQLAYPFPESGMVYKGQYLGLPRPAKKADTKTRVHISIQNEQVTNFPTPRRGITHSSIVTERSLHDLPTVLINSDEALTYMKERTQNPLPDKLSTIVIPNVNYIEWMMGYRADWTRIDKTKQDLQQEKKTARPTTPTSSVPPHPKKLKHNGMHVFMKENPGKDVKTIAAMWRILSPQEKIAYKTKLHQVA